VFTIICYHPSKRFDKKISRSFGKKWRELVHACSTEKQAKPGRGFFFLSRLIEGVANGPSKNLGLAKF